MKMARKFNMNEILWAEHKFLLGRKIKKKFKTKKFKPFLFIVMQQMNVKSLNFCKSLCG